MTDHPPPDRSVRVSEYPARPHLRISLFDGLTLHVGENKLALNNRKARALIAYLAVTPGMRETRERLVGLLWSEAEDNKARGSLRQLLFGLRDAFDREGFTGLSADNLTVGLDISLVATDLDCALEDIDGGDPADWLVSEPRIADAFLRGYDDVDPAFGSWLTTKRETVRRHLIQRLEAQLAQATYPADATKRIAHALFQIDPTHEIACQQLMRGHVASGNTSAALAVYKQLWDCLEQEYDIEPSAATQQLVVAIRNGTCRQPAIDIGERHAAAASLDDVDSVVFLAVKLAMSWARRSDPDALLDVPMLLQTRNNLRIADGV